MLGITNTVSFKGITFSALIDYKHGGDIWSQTIQFLKGRGTSADIDVREIPKVIPGVLADPNTLKPILGSDGKSIVNNIQMTENNLWFGGGGTNTSFAINGTQFMSVFDASVVRLREVSLGYSVPKPLLEKLKIANYIGAISLTITGRNLWFYTPNIPGTSNIDPELSSLGAGNAQGFDFFGLPSVRRYGFNLRVTF